MNNKTDIEEEIKQYKELKKNKFIIESIEPDYFFNFVENILADREEKEQYIKQIADMLVRVHSDDKKVEFIANQNIEEKKEQAREIIERKAKKHIKQRLKK